ncbi:MAG: ribonuclease E/G [Oceanicaulis sp.]
MSRKMLIDAAHPEETRVVVVENNRVEEFDFESASKKPIRGNIYLAKVTRVEPSLQAAFVEYGGNKHGFLAFNEIHPDYYQIPHADREELRKQEAELAKDFSDSGGSGDGDDEAETLNDEDDLVDEAAKKRRNFMRKYKIQEVIKRRQVLLVQVAKEERGNKGAALTTYLSLAGRYSVLMPNTARGGGISRKITQAADRKRLKSAVAELDVPGGMGLIIRTAGADRTKAEIKRDYEYLIRLWENIRTTTLESSAPALIYEEGNLVKRVIRDLYDKDIEEVQVEGEEAYKEAKAFMRMLMPSHAKKVQHYKDATPLFLRHQVESQLEAIHSPTAQLKSGGYIVINPTEALVSIDVNSGKSTKERNIEQTALRTNLEAAEEAARQMRLRDLAGLLVIDFIDMDENKNVRQVEKKMKDALKRDRARLQVGRISQFGLLEMSRQRRRTSLVEGSTDTCPHCGGAGHVRSIESSALVALRTLEEEGVRGRTAHARLVCPAEVALYLLNEKRETLNAIEQRYDMRVTVDADASLVRPDCKLDRLETRKEAARAEAVAAAEAPAITAADVEETTPDEVIDELDEEERSERSERSGRSDRSDRREASGEDDGNGKKRRRRGRRGGRNRRRREESGRSDFEANDALGGHDENGRGDDESGSGDDAGRSGQDDADDVLKVVEPTGGDDFSSSSDAEGERKPRRSRRRKPAPEKAESEAEAVESAPVSAEETPEPQSEERPKRRRRRKAAEPEAEAAEPAEADAPVIDEAPAAEPAAEEKPKPKRRTRKKKTEPAADPETAEAPVVDESPAAEPRPEPAPEPAAAKAEAPASIQQEPGKAGATGDGAAGGEETDEDGSPKPRKRGWWQRSSKFLGLS